MSASCVVVTPPPLVAEGISQGATYWRMQGWYECEGPTGLVVASWMGDAAIWPVLGVGLLVALVVWTVRTTWGEPGG